MRPSELGVSNLPAQTNMDFLKRARLEINLRKSSSESLHQSVQSRVGLPVFFQYFFKPNSKNSN